MVSVNVQSAPFKRMSSSRIEASSEEQDMWRSTWQRKEIFLQVMIINQPVVWVSKIDQKR